MKNKKYCAQKHLNSSQVMIQLEKAVRNFQDKAFDNIAQISHLSFTPRLCRISILPDTKGYIPHKGCVSIKDSCFNGEYVAWVTEFSFCIAANKEEMLAVYKIKDGSKILVPKNAVRIEYLWGSFWIGKYHFSYKRHKKGDISLTQYTVKTAR